MGLVRLSGLELIKNDPLAYHPNFCVLDYFDVKNQRSKFSLTPDLRTNSSLMHKHIAGWLMLTPKPD